MNRVGILIFGALGLLLLGAGVITYLTLRAPPPPPPPPAPPPSELPIIGDQTPTAPPGAGTPPTPIAALPGAERPLIQAIDKDIVGPTLGRDKQSLFYALRENGHLMQADLEGRNETTLTNLTVPEVFDVAWSPLKTRAVLVYHEAGVVKKFLQQTATTSPSRFLPQALTSLAWSPDGRQMAYLLPQGGKSALVIADQNGKNVRTVYQTPIPDSTVQWVSANTILLVSRPSGLAPSLVLRFDLKARRTTTLLSNIAGAVLLGAPDGTGVVYSASGRGGRPEPLRLHTLKGATTATLPVTTVAEKCAFSPDSKRLYCGVPRATIRAVTPDEWYRGALSFVDAIVKIDLASGRAEIIGRGIPALDVISPFLSADEKFFFFQDKKTGTVWRVQL
mgnify:FL=1